MNFSQTTTKGKAAGIAAVAMTLLLSSVANAQDFSGNSMGADQDSLLPPEVVPLDPATANSMSAQQAAQRQTSLGSASSVATEGNAVPGLVGNGVPNGMQTSKDARAAAFQSLYGQGQLPPMQAPLQASGVSQNQILGQNPMMNGSGSGPYGSAPQVPPIPAQSQRLSGAPKNQPKIRDIKRSGFSNTLSAVAGFGAGALTAGALMRPASPMMGLGMFGLTMTGFGVRNAFRF
jgi:hypothetical protein